MKRDEALAERFEAARPRLRGIALRILGSPAETDDALQESWLRISRAQLDGVENLEAYLTTVVARACLDILKRRESRREDLTPEDPRRDVAATAAGERPEEEVVLADSIGVALRVLLDALPPPERVAYVLHDMFDVPFDDIAAIVDRTPDAARQLASRARKRIRGATAERDAKTQRHDELVRAFLEASRAGNFRALLHLLDPAAAIRMDAGVLAMGGAAYWGETGIQGAEAVAQTFIGRARAAVPVLIDGVPGAAWYHEGSVRVAFLFAVDGERITEISMVAEPDSLARARIERD